MSFSKIGNIANSVNGESVEAAKNDAEFIVGQGPCDSDFCFESNAGRHPRKEADLRRDEELYLVVGTIKVPSNYSFSP